MTPFTATLVGIIAGLLLIVLIQCVAWRFERKEWRSERNDLYNRIMCNGIFEYEATQNGSDKANKKTPEGIHSKAIKKWNDKAMDKWK